MTHESALLAAVRADPGLAGVRLVSGFSACHVGMNVNLVVRGFAGGLVMAVVAG